MEEVITYTPITPGKPIGLKARVETLLLAYLEQCPGASGMTIGQISEALGLTKFDHPDISSVLVKLRNEGRLKSAMGPASSTRGKRFVKRHLIIPPKQPQIVIVNEVDVRRQLSFKG